MSVPLKLMIVDDSRMIRKAISRIFDNIDNVEVVGEAGNGAHALDMLPKLNPDVVTLDVNMPVMDGLTALKHIMIKSPTPVVMISTLTKEGSAVTFDALKYGALDFVHKPSRTQKISIREQEENIVKKVRLASRVEIENIRILRTPTGAKRDAPKNIECTKIFVMGAAEGGYGSLLKIIPLLSPNIPAAYFVLLYSDTPQVDAFARYLSANSSISVKRAVKGDYVKGGVCYLISGSEYIRLEPAGRGYTLQVEESPFSERRLALNVLMFSVAKMMKNHSAGIILSGSGNDGAEGVRMIARAGGAVAVQTPKNCLCQEMPRAAMANYPVEHIVSDANMAKFISSCF